MSLPPSSGIPTLSFASPGRAEALLNDNDSDSLVSGAFGRQVAIQPLESAKLTEEEEISLRPGRAISKDKDTTVWTVTVIDSASELKKLEPLVIKEMKSRDPYEDEKTDEEIAIHLSLDHENIAKAIGYFTSSQSKSLLMKRYQRTLKTILHNPNPYGDANDRIKMIHDIFSGLNYLHEKNIIHADLSQKNILQDENGRMIIADFGLSTRVADARNVEEGEFLYLAPEISAPQCKPLSKEADCFAVGGVALAIVISQIVNNLWARTDSKLNNGAFRSSFSNYFQQLPKKASADKDNREVMLTALFSDAKNLIERHGSKIADSDRELLTDTITHVVFPLLRQSPDARINIQEAIEGLNGVLGSWVSGSQPEY